MIDIIARLTVVSDDSRSRQILTANSLAIWRPGCYFSNITTPRLSSVTQSVVLPP
jgi:hypothetical protein